MAVDSNNPLDVSVVGVDLVTVLVARQPDERTPTVVELATLGYSAAA